MAINVLAQKAVLAGVTIRRWTGRRLDKIVTDEVNESRQASADAGRYNKLLLDKETFGAINSARAAARTAHYAMTLPWLDSGARILPSVLYDDFTKRFRKLQSAFDEAADEFAVKYPSYIEARKKKLKGMFRIEDYPDPKRVRGLFGLQTYVLPCPDVKDFRVALTQETVKEIQGGFEERLKVAVSDAMKEPYRRIADVVGKMSEKLKGYKPKAKEGVFRDSLVGNVRELAEVLPAFNLSGDKTLAGIIQRMEKELCKEEADTLREDDRVRKVVAKAADEILKEAEALMA